MITISNKEARENTHYRKIMAEALWAYRRYVKTHPDKFMPDPIRHFAFPSRYSWPHLFSFNIDSVCYDRVTGKMWVYTTWATGEQDRVIMIFE